MSELKIKELEEKLESMLPVFDKHGLLREGYDFWNVGANAVSDLACYYTWFLRPKTDTYIIAEYSHDLTMDIINFRFAVKSWLSQGTTIFDHTEWPLYMLLEHQDFSEVFVADIKSMLSTGDFFNALNEGSKNA